MFKKIIILFLNVLILSGLNAQTWTSDKAHSKLRFSVTHLGISEIDGVFQNFEATITSSKEDFSDAQIALNAETASVTTHNDGRDAHLKRADMFDAEQFPAITFKSTTVEVVEDKKFRVTGDLTIKGVTKPVTMDLQLNGLADDRRSGKKIAGFTATATLNRTDYGVGNMPGMMVSEEVELRASGEFKQN